MEEGSGTASDAMLAARLSRARQMNKDTGREMLVQEGTKQFLSQPSSTVRAGAGASTAETRDVVVPLAAVGSEQLAALAGPQSQQASPRPVHRPLRGDVGGGPAAAGHADGQVEDIDLRPARPAPHAELSAGRGAGPSADAAAQPFALSHRPPPRPASAQPHRGAAGAVASPPEEQGGAAAAPAAAAPLVAAAPPLIGVQTVGGGPASPGKAGRGGKAGKAALSKALARSAQETELHQDVVTRFLTPPAGGMVECFLRRERKVLGRNVYKLYIQREDGDEFLLAARRRQAAGHSYLLSRAEEDLEKGDNFIGKLRSNFMGTDWMLYDNGANPSRLAKAVAGAATLRRELGMISVQQNVLGSAVPRRFRVTLPANYLRARQPASAAESMPALAQQNQLSAKDHLFLASKEPRCNPATGQHSLDFRGRVTQGSVKNMQLVSTENPEAVIFQLGKVGKDEFTLDFAPPLSPLQAFAIGISDIAYKLAAEGG